MSLKSILLETNDKGNNFSPWAHMPIEQWEKDQAIAKKAIADHEAYLKSPEGIKRMEEEKNLQKNLQSMRQGALREMQNRFKKEFGKNSRKPTSSIHNPYAHLYESYKNFIKSLEINLNGEGEYKLLRSGTFQDMWYAHMDRNRSLSELKQLITEDKTPAVFRLLRLFNSEGHVRDDLGYHWVIDPSLFRKPSWRKTIGMVTGIRDLYVLFGELHSVETIDLFESAIVRAEYPDEYEITLSTEGRLHPVTTENFKTLNLCRYKDFKFSDPFNSKILKQLI